MFMTTPTPRRRRRRGSAWHWKQTDSWYCTPKGSKKRVPLLDELGKRIRGIGNKQAAMLAMARMKLVAAERAASDLSLDEANSGGEWLVARVCSEYLQDCRQRASKGRLSAEYLKSCEQYLNELCAYCGALAVIELKRGHVSSWVESRQSWRSPVTRRNVITIVLAAFYHAEREHGVRNPLKGLKKPPSRPRLNSISPEDEQALYKAAEKPLRDLLFAAIYTGLRPACELAKLKPSDVIESPRGMMWRVYSSKTKKTRCIPVRPEVATLVRKLTKVRPTEAAVPLFRNHEGKPWKRPTLKAHFCALRKQLGWDDDPVRGRYTCYACRHTFAHRMLSGYWNTGAGCSIETLAELLGDTPKTTYDHYGKEWSQHYQEPLWAALGE